MKKVSNTSSLCMNLGWIVVSYVIEKTIDYVFEEIKEAK